MYIIIRPETAETKETLCLVQAESEEIAKQIADVSPEHYRWLQVRDDFFFGFADVEHGMVEYEFPSV